VNTIAENGDMDGVAEAFFQYWKNANLAGLIALIDPFGEPEDALDVYRYPNLVLLDVLTAQQRNPALCDSVLSSGRPCREMEIVNLSEAGASERCREATPAESANGFGRRCLFFFEFAERPKKQGGSYSDAVFCVIVALRANHNWVEHGGPADQCSLLFEPETGRRRNGPGQPPE
jgi:hypothetical protein